MTKEKEIKDIRYKEWICLNTPISNTLKSIIETEDLLSELDDYSTNHNQCYPIFEDLKLQISSIRREFTAFVEKNREVLEINMDKENN